MCEFSPAAGVIESRCNTPVKPERSPQLDGFDSLDGELVGELDGELDGEELGDDEGLLDGEELGEELGDDDGLLDRLELGFEELLSSKQQPSPSTNTSCLFESPKYLATP